MNIKELFATLGIKIDDEDWKQADAVLNSVESGLELVGRAAEFASSLWETFVGEVTQNSVEIQKLATIMGVSTDQAQEWAYAAQQSGLSADDLTQLVAELAENLGEAAGGSGEAADAFQSLGLATKESNGKLKETPVALNQIADKLAAMADGQKKTAIITGLFGEEGIKLLPVLNQGSAGLKRYADEARALGLVLDESTIKKNTELAIQLKTLESILESVKQSIGQEFIPILVDLAKGFLEWWKINKDLVKQRLDKVFSLLKPVLWVIVTTLKILGAVLGFVIDNWKLFAVILGSVVIGAMIVYSTELAFIIGQLLVYAGAAASAGTASMIAWIKAAAPLIAWAALIAFVIILVEDLWGWFSGKDSLIGAIIDRWGASWSAFLDDFTRINPDDPWWLKAIRQAVAEVRELIALLQKINPRNAVEGAKSFTSGLFSGTQKLVDITKARSEGRAYVDPNAITPEKQAAFDSLANQGLGVAKKAGVGLSDLGPTVQSYVSPYIQAKSGPTIQNAPDNRQFNPVFNGVDSAEKVKAILAEYLPEWFGGELGAAKGGAK